VIAVAVALVALVLALFALTVLLLVLIGVHHEAPWTALDDTPPTPLARFARAVLGVHVRKTTEEDAKAVEITALIKGGK
jgi:hypothetical protein